MSQNPNVQYVAPTGDDDVNDGLSWGSPRATLHKAIETVVSRGGGTVYFASGSTYGGPVDGQGIWLRNDGVAVPGFINLNNRSVRIEGVGGGANQFVFEPPGPVFMTGASFSHLTPDIWVVGAEVPVEFANIKLFDAALNPGNGRWACCRLGWDYVRNDDFDIEWLNVTAASRTPGVGSGYDQTTYTVDLSAAYQWVAIEASRDANANVTMTLARPSTISAGPWSGNSPIHVVSTDPNFPSCNVVITSFSDVLTPGPSRPTITITYNDGQTSIAPISSPVAVSSATVQSHGCSAGDKITTDFTDPSFQTACMYTVTSATWNTITVNDPYGYLHGGSTASGTNIGQLVKQLRGKLCASAVRLERCSFAGRLSGIPGQVDEPTGGPPLDFGGSSANALRLDQCYFSGGERFAYASLPANQIDRDRSGCAVLANSGGDTSNSTSMIATDCQSQDGGVMWYGAINGGHLTVRTWLQDTGTIPFPTITTNRGRGNGMFDTIILENIASADATTVAAIQLDAAHDPLRVSISNTYGGAIDGSSYIGFNNVASNQYEAGAKSSPWTRGEYTFWPGGVSARHPGANRAMGVLTPRYKSIFPALSGWTTPAPLPSGVTVTQDGLAPDGSATAFKIVNTSGGPQQIIIGKYPWSPTDFDGSSFAVGDVVVAAAWQDIPLTGNAGLPGLTAGSYSQSPVFGGIGAYTQRPVCQPGWQWCVGAARVLEVTDPFAQALTILFNVVPGTISAPSTSYLWGALVIKIPASVPANDVAEFIGTLKHQPIYLGPGVSGTMDYQKFVAHGGMGIDTSVPKVAGAGSGQLTIGSIASYEPRYAADGTTIIGWAPLYSATINP